MMEYSLTQSVAGREFHITGVSYIGEPRSQTALFLTKKVQHLLCSLESVEHCLIFTQTGIEVPEKLQHKHGFLFSDNPQLHYARFATNFATKKSQAEQKLRYKYVQPGYYISETAIVGENAYIEPGCIIGHYVVIGSNAHILAGTVIKNAVIGDYLIANEHAVIGANGFTMTEDEQGNKIRVPTLGRVKIGNHVEIGAHDNISCGSGGDTIIEDYTKIDALVHIGHDVHLMRNVEITAGGIIGGFVNAGEHAYVGINAAVRNRINIGLNTTIGMGAVVVKSVESNQTVVGNPAREHNRK